MERRQIADSRFCSIHACSGVRPSTTKYVFCLEVLTSDSTVSLPIGAFSFVQIWTILAAKPFILVSSTVDTADFEKLRVNSRHSVEKIVWIAPLLKLEQARIEAAEI